MFESNVPSVQPFQRVICTVGLTSSCSRHSIS